MSYGNNVRDIIIAHVISVDAQTNRRGKHNAILRPAGWKALVQFESKTEPEPSTGDSHSTSAPPPPHPVLLNQEPRATQGIKLSGT